MSLFDDVKAYLDITYTDALLETKLTGMVERGKAYLNHIAGTTLNFDEEGQAKALLMNYVMYDRAGALDEFQINYKHELIALSIMGEVKNYDQKEASDI